MKYSDIFPKYCFEVIHKKTRQKFALISKEKKLKDFVKYINKQMKESFKERRYKESDFELHFKFIDLNI